jgi:hypothetical protein
LQATGRLFTALSSYKVRRILTGISGNVVTLNDTSSINADSQYKPFIIQNNKVAQIVNVLSLTEIEIDQDPGFIVGNCYTPWSSRWVSKIGDRSTAIKDGDIVVGQDSDIFQIVAHQTYGIKTAMVALWQIGKGVEPTASNVSLFTPTSYYHLLPDADIDPDITNIVVNNLLDNMTNKVVSEAIKDNVWCKPSNFTRNLFIDTSKGWLDDLEVHEQMMIPVHDNSLNYIELDGTGTIIVNTSGWTQNTVKVAEVTTQNGIILTILQKWTKGTITNSIPSQIQKENEIKVNQLTTEPPNGSRITFTLPNGDHYIGNKVFVFVNGLREYDIICASDTSFSIVGPALESTDILRIDYVMPQKVAGELMVNQIPVETPDGSRRIFTLPNMDSYISDKIMVCINGLREYSIQMISPTTVQFDSVPPVPTDVVRFDYVKSV